MSRWSAWFTGFAACSLLWCVSEARYGWAFWLSAVNVVTGAVWALGDWLHARRSVSS